MAYLRRINGPTIFCNSTVFSDVDNSSGFTSSITSYASGTSTTAKGSSNNPPTDMFPVLPQAHNFSALGNLQKFQQYIAVELPLALDKQDKEFMLPPSSPPPPTDKGVRRRDVNSVYLNQLLKKIDKTYSPEAWIEKQIFPDSKLPVPFNEPAIRASKELWNAKTFTYARGPVDMDEPRVREWLSNIANNLAVVHNIADGTLERCDRSFDSSTATKGPSGSYMYRRPDISVINRALHHEAMKNQEKRLDWNSIYSFVEVTTKKSPAADLRRQISEKASCLFDVQPQRTFVCALAIYGKPDELFFFLALVDRAGMTSTRPVKIGSYSIFVFMRVVFAFCFANPETLGWDPSMTVDPETYEVTSIAVTGEVNDERTPTVTTRVFDIVKLIHSSPILYSCGTRVWIVKDGRGNFYVLKDSWILEANAVSEIDLTKHINAAIERDPDGCLFQSSCPSYIIGQNCVCSTDTIRGILQDRPPTRHRRRIVTAAIGDPITSFRSKTEFVSVFLDIVNTLEYLSTTAGVIHGDISINNVLINRVWNYKPGHSPSQLCDRAIIKLQTNMNANVGPVIQPPAVPAPVIQSSAVQGPVVQGPAPLVVDTSDSSIDSEGTTKFIESAGMVIDCDFMRFLVGPPSSQTSGTLPFMALEALLAADRGTTFVHTAGHDLECLLNTILTICHYTIGPCGQLRELDPKGPQIQLNKWFSTENWKDLASLKSITLEAYDSHIEGAIPPYWKDFGPFLRRLISVTWDGLPFMEHRNIATHQAYRDILKDALEKYASEEKQTVLGPYAFIPTKKRPFNSEDDQGFQPSKRSRRSKSVGPSQRKVRPRNPKQRYLEHYQDSFEPGQGGSNVK
ncbi:hypothetical protein B0H34DRAFT_808831 [Crassisporium funariophilum]|nr:hypothetical protein B0H34DRAFT_808831 [Crassisporium funariophilum]